MRARKTEEIGAIAKEKYGLIIKKNYEWITMF